MNRLLINILNNLVKSNPDKCKEIIYQRSLVFYEMVAYSNGKNIEVWNIIPFFWQYANKRRCCLPGASEGKTWGLLSEILYDEKKGVYAVKCWNYQSGPPDEDEIPIEMVDDNVIVSIIYLLLANISSLSSYVDINLIFNRYDCNNDWKVASRIACKIIEEYIHHRKQSETIFKIVKRKFESNLKTWLNRIHL